MKSTKLILGLLTIFCSLTINSVNADAKTMNSAGNKLFAGSGTTFLDSMFSESSASKEPVFTTTLVKKHKDKSSLQIWFPYYFASAGVSGATAFTVKNHQALSFDAYLDGRKQRTIAIDYGNYFLVSSATNLNISLEDLFTQAEIDYDNSLKSEGANLKAMSGCECTDYAHDLVPTLPHGLFTYQDKENTINHLFPQGNGGQMSSVAVHNIGSVGHVSVVTGVSVKLNGNLNVSLTEKNLQLDCRITTRTSTMEAMNIVGYFDPRYSVTSSFPNVAYAYNTTGTATVPFTVNLSGSSFDTGSMKAIILGGSYCTTFTACQVSNGFLQNKTSSSVDVPLQLNIAGSYRLYIHNANTGKTSFGAAITIN